MELYRFLRKDFKGIGRIFREVSSITGETRLHHAIDYLFCSIRYGCGPIQYYEGSFYKLKAFERRLTYTYKRRDYISKCCNDKKFLHISANKVSFNKHFDKYIKRDWAYCKEISREDLETFITHNPRILFKPINLTKGKGIHELDRTKPIGELVDELMGKDVLLEEYLVQHPQMCYNNNSVNTLRITTILDKKGVAHVIRTSIRVGVGDAIVDNYSSGGVAYPVSMKYGRIDGPGINSSRGQDVYVHPGTDIYMLGREIPFLQEALNMVKEAAESIPQLRFVGWDVAITEKGPELIEGNTKPGEKLMELFGSESRVYKRILSYL